MEAPRSGTVRLLAVAPFLPSRLKLRSYELLRGMAARRGFELSLVCLGSRGSSAPVPGIDDMVAVPRGFGSGTGFLRSVLRGDPLQVALTADEDFVSTAIRVAREFEPAVIVAFHLRAAAAALSAAADLRTRGVQVRTILDAGDCCTRLWHGASRFGHGYAFRAVASLESRLLCRFESRILPRFDAVVAAAPSDARLFRRMVAVQTAHVIVVPNGVHPSTTSVAHGEDVMFAGVLDYHPNLAAAHRLVTRIMPLVVQERPRARLRIVGANPPRWLRRLLNGEPSVSLHANVPDMGAAADGAGIVVAPLTYGAGTQLKLLEAAARGQAIVTTPRARRAVGFGVEHAMTATSDQGFANAVVQLLDSPRQREALGNAARRYVMASCQWNQAVERWTAACWPQDVA